MCKVNWKNVFLAAGSNYICIFVFKGIVKLPSGNLHQFIIPSTFMRGRVCPHTNISLNIFIFIFPIEKILILLLFSFAFFSCCWCQKSFYMLIDHFSVYGKLSVYIFCSIFNLGYFFLLIYINYSKLMKLVF